jgi:hypothetical protein
MWTSNTTRQVASRAVKRMSRSSYSTCQLSATSSLLHFTVRTQRFTTTAAVPREFWKQSFRSDNRNHQPWLVRAFTTTKNTSSNTSSPKRNNSSSNWWLRLGWTLLGLVVLDQALQIKQEWEDEGKRQVLKQMQKEADDNHPANFNESLPTLFECRLLHVEQSLDGTKMLTRKHQATFGNTSLQAGDLVEVIEANVGPNQAYHVCRVKSREHNSTSPLVGWYPVMFLERVE